MGIDLQALAWAVLAYLGIGTLWYSPFVFGRCWLRHAELRRNDLMAHWKAVALSVLLATVSGFILSLLLLSLTNFTAITGGAWGALIWLGFILPTQALEVIYYGRKIQLFLIDSGCQLLGFTAMGAILGSLLTP